MSAFAFLPNHVGRVPAAGPFVSEPSHLRDRLPPWEALSAITDQTPQRITDQVAPGSALRLRLTVHFPKELIRQRN
ncbi:MAG TPA: hypothetical protein VGL03_12835 [Thermoanaerobaculia bacterium]